MESMGSWLDDITEGECRGTGCMIGREDAGKNPTMLASQGSRTEAVADGVAGAGLV
jgi:hypothetical protein